MTATKNKTSLGFLALGVFLFIILLANASAVTLGQSNLSTAIKLGSPIVNGGSSGSIINSSSNITWSPSCGSGQLAYFNGDNNTIYCIPETNYSNNLIKINKQSLFTQDANFSKINLGAGSLETKVALGKLRIYYNIIENYYASQEVYKLQSNYEDGYKGKITMINNYPLELVGGNFNITSASLYVNKNAKIDKNLTTAYLYLNQSNIRNENDTAWVFGSGSSNAIENNTAKGYVVQAQSIHIQNETEIGYTDINVTKFGSDLASGYYDGSDAFLMKWSNCDSANCRLELITSQGNGLPVWADSFSANAFYGNGASLTGIPQLTANQQWTGRNNFTLGLLLGADLNFTGLAKKSIIMGESNSNGNDLIIRAGSGNKSMNDRNGGILYLDSGQPTGTGSSGIYFRTVPANTNVSGNATATPITQGYFNHNGALCIGKESCTGSQNPGLGGLDVAYGGSPFTLMLGAENNLETRTNATGKVARFATAPYSTNSLPVAGFIAFNDAHSNTFAFGGSSSVVQAITQFDIYTAPDTQVPTGTSRMRIDGNGNTTFYSADVSVTNGTITAKKGITSQANITAQDSISFSRMLNVGQVASLPTCTTGTVNGSIMRNSTKLYFCDGVTWNGLY